MRRQQPSTHHQAGCTPTNTETRRGHGTSRGFTVWPRGTDRQSTPHVRYAPCRSATVPLLWAPGNSSTRMDTPRPPRHSSVRFFRDRAAAWVRPVQKVKKWKKKVTKENKSGLSPLAAHLHNTLMTRVSEGHPEGSGLYRSLCQSVPVPVQAAGPGASTVSIVVICFPFF